MSANRILKKRRQQTQNIDHQYPTNHQQQPQQPTQQQLLLEDKYQAYYELSQSNPSSYEFSTPYLPHNASLHSKFKLPLSLFFPPVSYQTQPSPISIDNIPRCMFCRGYMNYYNKIQKRGFTCFICGKQNGLPSNYITDENNIELNQVSYHLLGGQNIYTKPPSQSTFTFLIDLNVSSFESKMLYYFVAAAKQILSREQLNETVIYFFTYDDTIHEYDFSGEEVTCTVIDGSIHNIEGRNNEQTFLGNIRDKLFQLLDQLEEMSQKNTKQSSNFFNAFSYVVQTVKHTSSKIFIFQSNEAILGEPFANQYHKKTNNQIDNRPKSLLQTKNKTLLNKYADIFTAMNISFSMFVFSRNYKNLRVFGDLAKLTNSELLLYRKDNTQDILKFYYDLNHLLGTVYYTDIRMEIVISPGWYPSAIYSNLYRLKEYVTFKITHLEPSKRACLTFSPHQNTILPYCAIQIISHYQYNRQHFVTVNTSVLPLTSSLQKLYANQNYAQTSATLHKTALSGLRMEQINMFRNKTVKQISLIWKAANDFFKKKPSPQISSLLLSALGLLKSPHFQIDSINDSIVLDTVICQRNFLQSCGIMEIQNFFSPYLFNLSSMTEQMCLDNEDFVYPQICELKFASVKQGMYLMDSGLALYLYISKVCDPSLILQLFGKQKFAKGQIISEDSLKDDTFFAQQVSTLIRVCRQQKSRSWIPLYIVRCGQNSLNEKLFYMNFYAEKYDEFRTFKMTLPEFIALLSQQY